MQLQKLTDKRIKKIINASEFNKEVTNDGIIKFYCKDSEVNKIYKIDECIKTDRGINIYTASLNGENNFIAKYSPERNQIMSEARMQNKCSLIGLSPAVRQVWICEPFGGIIISDRLTFTVDESLEKLTTDQLNFALFNKKILLEIMNSTDKISKWKIDFYGKDLEQVNTIEQLKKITDMLQPYADEKQKTQLKIILPEDSEKVKLERINMIDRGINLLHKLHKTTGLCHGDAHFGNFMFNKHSRLYIIDFGSSFQNDASKDQLKYFEKDFDHVIYSVNRLCEIGYTNLRYLVEYAVEKLKSMNLKEIIEETNLQSSDVEYYSSDSSESNEEEEEDF